jgi:ABC-type dipeptide/oligopeptide/nickel transport system permease subunit
VARFADALSCFPPWPILIVISALTQVGQVMNLRSIEIAAGVLLAPKLIRLVAASPAPSNWPRLVLDRLARDWKNLILLLATVDFLGRGVQPPTPTLGHMTSSALNYIFFGWWIALFPCLTFFVIILAIELARRAYLSPGKRLSS